MDKNNGNQCDVKCKTLEVVLLSNKIRARDSSTMDFNFTYQMSEFNIHVKYCEVEIITINAKRELPCMKFWNCFLDIYKLQTLGTGYFYVIHQVEFYYPLIPISDELSEYAKKCMKNIATYFITDPNWIDKRLRIADPEELVNAKNFFKFLELLENDKLLILHNASLVHCSNTGMNIEMRCAGIIQLFENLSWYMKDETRDTSHSSCEWSLSNGLNYIFKHHGLKKFRYHLNNGISVKRLNDTRNRIMHYDIWKEPSEYLSGKECMIYGRILIIYYRYIILKLIGYNASDEANQQIAIWFKVYDGLNES